MNDKIKNLAIEAGLYVDVNGKPWPRNMTGEDIEGAYELFAKLVINKCLRLVNETQPGYKDYRSQIEQEMKADCMESIERYFDDEGISERSA
jgi:hypothetical protein